MIQVIYRCLLTMANKKIDKNKHSHEMTRFWNRIAIWSSQHEPIQTFRSSHGSVFESPVYRVHNGTNPNLPWPSPNLTKPVRNAVTRTKHTHKYKYTLTHSHVHMYSTHAHTYMHVRTHIHTYKSIYIHTHYIYIHLYIHTMHKEKLTHDMYPHTYNYTHAHTYIKTNNLNT